MSNPYEPNPEGGFSSSEQQGTGPATQARADEPCNYQKGMEIGRCAKCGESILYHDVTLAAQSPAMERPGAPAQGWEAFVEVEQLAAALRAQLTARDEEREAIRNELPKEWREGDLLECVMATVEELGYEKRDREAAEAEVDRLKAELERLRDVVSPTDVELIDAALAPSSAETGDGK